MNPTRTTDRDIESDLISTISWSLHNLYLVSMDANLMCSSILNYSYIVIDKYQFFLS